MNEAGLAQRVAQIDEELVALTSSINILSTLSWDDAVQQRFLSEVERGNYQLPEITYPARDESERIDALTKLASRLGSDHPVFNFQRRTIESYIAALRMLEGAGTRLIGEISTSLYGRPRDLLPGYHKTTNLDAAWYFLSIVHHFNTGASEHRPTDQTLSAEDLRTYLEQHIHKVIQEDMLDIVIDRNMAARASAAVSRVRLRESASFSAYDAEQLLQHEVFIHSLTSLNGRKQPHLRSLGYSAPRTTATQEGLATFAEFVTGCIDMARLKRIALRIVAIDMATRGANLIELFQFFREHGQTPEESYLSSMRVLRGGQPAGGIVFYKDNVYLRGLIELHGFFAKMMHDNRLDAVALLFAGKMTTSDVLELIPFVEEGLISAPKYLPPWFHNLHSLAAFLAFSLFANKLNIGHYAVEE